MKKLSIFLFLFILYGCSEEVNPCDNPEFDCTASVESHWELIEVLADPGNGSGSFNEVSSERNIIFLTDNTFISEGLLCNPDLTNTEIHTGNIRYGDSENTLEFEACDNTIDQVRFVIEGDELLVYFQCIEACIHKYKRVD